MEVAPANRAGEDADKQLALAKGRERPIGNFQGTLGAMEEDGTIHRATFRVGGEKAILVDIFGDILRGSGQYG
jgi:hypothetical protein